MENADTPRAGTTPSDGSATPVLSVRARRVLSLFTGHPDGLSDQELLAAAAVETATISTTALTAALRDAGPLVTRRGHRWTLTTPLATETATDSDPATAAAQIATTAVTRIVIVDVETDVRPCGTAPYIERNLWQIGAARGGTDRAWVDTQPTLVLYVEVPDDITVPTRRPSRSRRIGDATCDCSRCARPLLP